MTYLTGDAYLDGLPLILAGPMLRRTEAGAVSVWLACKSACQVTLQVYETQNQGQEIGALKLSAEQQTIPLGQHLHLVTVTAHAAQPLSGECIYAYTLVLALGDRSFSLTEALRSPQLPTATVSYFAHELPTFALPPQQVNDLKLVHASCRKTHGEGYDTLPLLDNLIEAQAGSVRDRPHQLFLTGDQIYADDVADPMLWLGTSLSDTLLGWTEPLPVGDANPSQVYTPKELPPGKRAELATHSAGFTGGFGGDMHKVTSHLLSLGEYLLAYVLSRSPACWPAVLPEGKEIIDRTDRKAIRRWNKDRSAIQQFRHTLWKVQRAIANIPCYGIFDDHDVSDDWNLNQQWCLRVLGRPLGYRTVQNALLSYALCQAWGNTPDQFSSGTGAALLAAAQQWAAAAGQDSEASSKIAACLGLPPLDPVTHLPEFDSEGEVLVLRRTADALKWHYTAGGPAHEVLALDTRTWRGYPAQDKPTAPPMLLCPSAFEQQIERSLTQPAPAATFVIAPTNPFAPKILDRIHTWQLHHHKVFSADVGDSWNMHDPALAKLLTTLFSQRQRVILLSGDIHFSSAVQLSFKDFKAGQHASLVQLTSSAMKNEELLTRLLHSRLKQWLLPERPRQWLGWTTPPDMVETPVKDPVSPPDWTARLEWLPRQNHWSLDIHPNLFWLIPPRQRHSWIDWLKFWHSRWFMSGREIVGRNNIALIRLHTDPNPAAEPTPLTPLKIEQTHYWFSPWSPVEVVCSGYRCVL